MHQHGLRSRGTRGGEQRAAVGDDGELGVRRAAGYCRNALLQIDDHDGRALRIEIRAFVAHCCIPSSCW